MIPLRDNIPSRNVPVVNYTMIALCTLAFFAQLADPAGTLVERWGMIPARTLNPDRPIVIRERYLSPTGNIFERDRPVADCPTTPWLTLLTCIFLHGGWMHFLGNMWFLFIFGDNVEDRMGRVGYLLFYLGAGVLASATHLATNAGSGVPTIGASGAIAGVMGAYLLLYPRAMILSILPIIVFVEVIVVPAPVYLVIWFLLQFVQGTAALSSATSAGVAWWAHIGGFAAGFLVAAILRSVGETRPPVVERRPNSESPRFYRYRP